jgi:ABC-type antimicrobial peptide transport system permease subunit
MERDVEFATLDTLDVSKRQVAFSIIVEMAFIEGMSAAIGIPFAYLFGKIIAVTLESVIFYFPVILTIGSAITTFIIGVLFVLLSSIVPIRYSRKLDTEVTIRERTAG